MYRKEQILSPENPYELAAAWDKMIKWETPLMQ
jgi:hypothetical protein